MNYRETLYKNYFKNHLGKRSGEEYKNQFEEEKRQFLRDLESISSSLNRSGKYFDAGCGTGSLLSVLSDLGFKNLSGMDISKEQVDVAKSFNIAYVEEGDVLSFLQSTEQTFDGIFSMDFVEHLTKDELINYLLTVKNKLKDNGFLICRTPNADAPVSSIYAFGDASHETILNKKSAEQLFTSCGFDKVIVWPSSVRTNGFLKEIIRSITYSVYLTFRKMVLFMNGYSNKEVIHSPNLLIYCKK
ncbi:MAG: Ubiquinone biosynthesis O-methyltransferase [Bacteroidetes bacterium MED-G17]|nr:MAG: Ubiquinone biosynthesis O-methyltransferase [Bacteroidetes bacterium MED-G17]